MKKILRIFRNPLAWLLIVIGLFLIGGAVYDKWKKDDHTVHSNDIKDDDPKYGQLDDDQPAK